MKKNILAVGAVFLMALCAGAQDAAIISLSGKVEVKQSDQTGWVVATEGMTAGQGGSIRTGAGGEALIEFHNKARIWMKESSVINLEERKGLITKLKILLGTIKVQVPHLKWREIFEINSKTAVAAVRGTEFTLFVDDAGNFHADVLYGEVKFNYVVPPLKGPRFAEIPQGYSFGVKGEGKPGDIVMLTPKQETDGLQNWNPGLSGSQRMEHLEKKKAERGQIRDFARVSRNTRDMIRDLIYKVKEDDIETGRTLKDVHGNVVRVDQRLMRPAANSVQVVNLVKRPNYVYNATVNMPSQLNGNYSISGYRMDSLQIKADFSMNLPQNMTDWGVFFKNNPEEQLHANTVVVTAANQTDPTNLFADVAVMYWNSSEKKLKNLNGEVFGQIDNTKLSDGTTPLSRLINGAFLDLSDQACPIIRQAGAEEFIAYSTLYGSNSGDWKPAKGMIWAMKDDSAQLDVHGEGPLYKYSAFRYCVGGVCQAGNYVWRPNSIFVTDNGGSIRNVSDITDTSKGLSRLINNTAGELIVQVRGDQAGTGWDRIAPQTAGVDFSHSAAGFGMSVNRNIDLVGIPDMGFTLLQRMLPVLMHSDSKISN